VSGTVYFALPVPDIPMFIFGRKIFRKLYGPKYEDGEWKNRTKRELDEMSKGENIVK
jgi:hypothetical protein